MHFERLTVAPHDDGSVSTRVRRIPPTQLQTLFQTATCRMSAGGIRLILQREAKFIARGFRPTEAVQSHTRKCL